MSDKGRRGEKRRTGGGGGGGKGRSGDRPRPSNRDKGNNGQQQSAEVVGKRPIILAKPERDRDFPALQQSAAQIQSREASTPPAAEDIQSNDISPKHEVQSRVEESVKKKSEDCSSSVPGKACKLVEDQTFCDGGLADFLTDNSDFLVVGVVGLQNVGKSSLLNSLIRPWWLEASTGLSRNNKPFRTQSFEKQMLAEYCSSGITGWISPQRIVYLDTHPVNSVAVLDRAIQTEKKYAMDFSSSENAAEMYSLQMIGFLMNVCHVILVVQDWFCDTNLIRMLKTAEMLKPSSPAPLVANEETSQVVEHYPEIIHVHNKAHLDEFSKHMIQTMKRFYQETLPPKMQQHEVRLVVLPDLAVQDENMAAVSYEEALKQLGLMVSSTVQRPLSTMARQTEKTWLLHAQKAWDNVKTSQFYHEYNRLLP